MAVILIPPLLRDITQGKASVEVRGRTVGEVLKDLDKMFPGIEGRLCEKGEISPHVALVVDGEQSELGVFQPVDDRSEIQFLPAFEGG